MHRLFLLRHAEALQGKPGGSDKERPLSERGKDDAIALGRRMNAQAYRPSMVFCSDARRTRDTWAAISSGLPPPAPETIYIPELYRGGTGDYRILAASSPAEGPLLIIGHNPMISQLALSLVRNGDESGRAALASGFPPGALAVLEFPQPLSQIAPRTASLVAFLRPGS
ncbi:histidine phosphatase family protein [Chelativorans sp. Marseille-P2723]|uniref:SixA phosphatase family protein n=1 Tax=Chelativorans sp. Marseille-P2723 TaxID=2709133 RepID=UPI001570F122|nr:histidine phosphatase family protein [Chelativorans sp. Marseille-P2723]